MKNTLRTYSIALKQAISMVAVFGVVIIGLIGAVVYPFPYRKIGHYIVTTNAAGIGIYQPGTHSNYTISPHADDPSTRSDRQTAISIVDTLKNRWATVLHYFNAGTFTYKNNSIVYTGQIQGYTIDIQRTAQEAIVQVFPYNRDDLVMDKRGTLFTENSDPMEQLAEEIFAIRLTRDAVTSRTVAVNGNTVSIINPHVPGVLIVTAPDSYTMTIDKDTKRILIHGPTTQTGYTVRVADSPAFQTVL